MGMSSEIWRQRSEDRHQFLIPYPEAEQESKPTMSLPSSQRSIPSNASNKRKRDESSIGSIAVKDEDSSKDEGAVKDEGWDSMKDLPNNRLSPFNSRKPLSEAVNKPRQSILADPLKSTRNTAKSSEQYQKGSLRKKARADATKQLLLAHLRQTIPSLAHATIDDVSLRVAQRGKYEDRVGYHWEFLNGYEFARANYGTGGYKALSNWTIDELAALKKALEDGDLRAVVNEGKEGR
ncbi:hypothetical protein BJ508DRAFT_341117 [Ascobolus immersus RN42]|uniref:Uncharacterized protein n=1 Tax=Ascobolus immersus RN42 TaxID=1160509 RepID=A0A3N4ID92_ASCIM|nr:hypothetical protein BJ508DRAFT_341117 [Ascobolus immersus RN42]